MLRGVAIVLCMVMRVNVFIDICQRRSIQRKSTMMPVHCLVRRPVLPARTGCLHRGSQPLQRQPGDQQPQQQMFQSTIHGDQVMGNTSTADCGCRLTMPLLCTSPLWAGQEAK